MPRIVVFGNPGAGKSTFARSVARQLELPFFSLDALFWKPGWVESNHDEFRARAQPLIEQKHYVLDGNYFTPLGEDRLRLADHVFWFDLPRLVCMGGVVRRMVMGYGRTRPEMAEGCLERLDLPFLRFVWNYPARNQAKFAVMIVRNDAQQKLTRFTSRKQVGIALARIAREGLA
jgi:adenylate kinase family enzyme